MASAAPAGEGANASPGSLWLSGFVAFDHWSEAFHGRAPFAPSSERDAFDGYSHVIGIEVVVGDEANLAAFQHAP
jgi:hypothetical protein